MKVDYAVHWPTSSGGGRNNVDNEGRMIGILPARPGAYGGLAMKESPRGEQAVIIDAKGLFHVVDLKCVVCLGEWEEWAYPKHAVAAAAAEADATATWTKKKERT